MTVPSDLFLLVFGEKRPKKKILNEGDCDNYIKDDNRDSPVITNLKLMRRPTDKSILEFSEFARINFLSVVVVIQSVVSTKVQRSKLDHAQPHRHAPHFQRSTMGPSRNELIKNRPFSNIHTYPNLILIIQAFIPNSYRICRVYIFFCSNCSGCLRWLIDTNGLSI
jgi:hypothetical protein